MRAPLISFGVVVSSLIFLTGLLAPNSLLAFAQNRLHATDVPPQPPNLGGVGVSLSERPEFHLEHFLLGLSDVEENFAVILASDFVSFH